MCVIIVKESKSKKIKENILRRSAELNPHGLGVVWLDNYKLEYFSSMEYNVLDTNRPFIAHFRFATIGGNTPENRHPFKIRDKEYLFQNGTNNNLGYEDKTDTEHLAEVLSKCDRGIWKYILELTESRYCTVNLKEKSFEIYNKKLWFKDDGVLYSKDNVFRKELVAVYGTLKKGNSNYNYYLSDQEFVGHGSTYDRYPMIIEGLPYVLPIKGVGEYINVDVFSVDNECLVDLDLLEGHPHWYRREKIPIILDSGEYIYAWLYFNDTVEDTGIYHKSFCSYDKDDYLWEDCGEEMIYGEDFIL